MNSTERTATVVVGAEGTSSSQDALVWAARAAAARDAELVVVHAMTFPMSAYEIAFDESMESHAQTVVDDAVARIGELAPEVRVRGEVVRGGPGRVLIGRSQDADLLVIGSRHPGLVERTLAGSLGYQVAAGAHCPVVVVGPGSGEASTEGRGVVVGTDGSPDARLAVAMAAGEASRTGQELHIVHAWAEPGLFVPMDYMTPGVQQEVAELARRTLADAVAEVNATHPDLVVHEHLVAGRPAGALLEAAKGAALLVVGSRGLHGVARMLLGSVSHAVVQRAPCPVLIVRPQSESRSGSEDGADADAAG